MELDLLNYLLSTTAVTNVVGQRVQWARADQNVVRPNIVLHVISGNRDTTNDGPSGFVTSRVQVDCYGLTFMSAKTVARAVETTLSGASFASGSTYFQACFLDSERSGEEDAASPDKLFRVSLDFIILHGGL